MSDLDFGPLMIGCLPFGPRLDAAGVTAVVDAAIDVDVAVFDTADAYGFGASEELLGRAIAGRRDEVVIATKFGMTMQGANGDETARSSPEYMRRALEASLRRLGVDHIDLYQWHTPDRVTSVADTIGAMTQLVDAGLVRAIGASNLTGDELAEALDVAESWGFSRFVTVQNEYSLYNRSAEADLIPVCEDRDVGLLPYFPLAAGLLTGSYQQGRPAVPGSRLASHQSRLEKANWDLIDTFRSRADDLGITLPQLAIGYLAAQPAVASVVVGASTPEQVHANAQAARSPLAPEDVSMLAALPHVDSGHTTFATRRTARSRT